MESIGSFEAKTHLPQLLKRASQGETIVITKNGKPMARLMPPTDAAPLMSVEEAIAGLREFRKAHPLNGVTIRELIDEGRRY